MIDLKDVEKLMDTYALGVASCAVCNPSNLDVLRRDTDKARAKLLAAIEAKCSPEFYVKKIQKVKPSFLLGLPDQKQI